MSRKIPHGGISTTRHIHQSCILQVLNNHEENKPYSNNIIKDRKDVRATRCKTTETQHVINRYITRARCAAHYRIPHKEIRGTYRE